MNYIVLDLEWNQSDTGNEPATKEIPFEIIDIGAVKLNSDRIMTDEFNQLIKPSVYHHMHKVTGKLIHLHMRDLKKGRPFTEVAKEFLSFCGTDFIFCTWGPLDLFELQRNMHYYKMPPLSDVPVRFLDVQKLFSIAFEDGKSRRSLEHAVDMLEIPKDIPFHRALSDAVYTARILERIVREKEHVLQNHSYDVFHPPADRKAEIKIRFDQYEKYISREFQSREQAFEDREVVSSKCYICRRNLRKKLRWFTSNGRNYYCLAYCEEHGYLKGKIRVRKSEDGGVYIVKTTKLISPQKAEELKARRDHIKEQHRPVNKGPEQ